MVQFSAPCRQLNHVPSTGKALGDNRLDGDRAGARRGARAARRYCRRKRRRRRERRPSPRQACRRRLRRFAAPFAASRRRRLRAGSARRPIISRMARILSSCEAMKLWPPKPGLTLMTSTRSISSSTYCKALSCVAGLSDTPAFLPRARIACSERCRCGPFSAWTVMTSAPASAKAPI